MIEEKSLVSKVSALVKPDEQSSGMATMSAKAVAEVQASMAIAKKFPRDEEMAFKRIIKACERRSLAESAVYEFPRGGTKVTGPSIRLAEALAQNWGNIETGIEELERRDGESTARAFCVDLETNYRKSVTFSVPHERKAGQKLSDARDIYETVMNNGSRRLRNCILAVIPGDIADAAVEACESTLRGAAKGAAPQPPLADRVKVMLSSFAEFGVTEEMVEKRLGNKIAAITENQLVILRRTYVSIKDGVGKIADFFDVAGPKSTGEELSDFMKFGTEPGPVKPKVKP